MKLDRQVLPQVDITDLIRILCGFRRERFKFEKDIAFRTFNAWMLWPDQPDVVYQAQIISAGLIIKAIKGGFLSLKTTSRSKWISALMEHVMPLEGVAELILDLPLKSRFFVEAHDQFGLRCIYLIVEFFLACPSDLQPSLNKAIFLIKNGGAPLISSAASLKADWTKYLVSSPFIFVNFPAVDFQPDAIRNFDEGVRLVSDTAKMRRYFESARYVQELLIKRLDPITRNRFKFIDFPEGVDPRPVQVDALTEDKIKLLEQYRAPKSS